MKKTIRILSLAAAFLMLLSGCSGGLFRPHPSAGEIPDYDKYIADYGENPLYLSLDQEAKDNYGAVYTVLTDSGSTDTPIAIADSDGKKETKNGVRISLPHPIYTQEQASSLYNAFFRDNPQFFFMDSTYTAEGYMKQDKPVYDTLVLVYAMPANQRAAAAEELEQTVAKVLADCPAAGDPFETELYLHDWLAANCVYDTTVTDDDSSSTSHAFSAYGALVEGRAVCEGYARAMQLLLRKAHIPSVLAVGKTLPNQEEHMWNVVTVNGQSYHLDVTWDDSDAGIRHTYFNITDEEIRKTHQPLPNQAFMPVCTAVQDNYFIKKGLYIDTYSRQDIAKVIAGQVSSGSTVIELKFEKDKKDNGLLFLKNTKLVKRYVEACLPESCKPFWDYNLSGEKDGRILILEKRR